MEVSVTHMLFINHSYLLRLWLVQGCTFWAPNENSQKQCCWWPLQKYPRHPWCNVYKSSYYWFHKSFITYAWHKTMLSEYPARIRVWQGLIVIVFETLFFLGGVKIQTEFLDWKSNNTSPMKFSNPSIKYKLHAPVLISMKSHKKFLETRLVKKSKKKKVLFLFRSYCFHWSKKFYMNILTVNKYSRNFSFPSLLVL